VVQFFGCGCEFWRLELWADRYHQADKIYYAGGKINKVFQVVLLHWSNVDASPDGNAE
jgi:hypothetical protein